jgi:eukaryotic-like serine/threonine-protein kinase
MPLPAGERLGPYEILSPLGKGGMGEVYRARDTKLGRDVALKILPAAFALDPDRLARFKREAHVLASLNHPHIAAIHGFEDSGPLHALVMELVEGPTLSDRIAQGRIPLDEALPIAKQIAEALETAHEQGIIHRDLKPANIKVREDGTVKVLDFGLAKALEPTSVRTGMSQSPTITSPDMTGIGVILGSAAYMSPEQARGKLLDKRTDIWAFGVVLFEMLTGQHLFTGETVSDTLIAVATKEPDWERIPALPGPNVRRLLRRCLEKDAKRRLRDIGDAWDLLDESTQVAGLPGGPPRHRWELAAWSIAGLFVLATAILALPIFRRLPEEKQVVRFNVLVPEGFIHFGRLALSPNGRRLVFAASPSSEDKRQLWMRDLDSLSTRPLPGTDLPQGIQAGFFWSPDNKHLAYFADGKLKKIDVSGGQAETICEAPGGSDGDWNRDDVIVFGSAGNSGPLYRVPASGGNPMPVVTPEASALYLTSPQFLPDGRRFLYTAATRRYAGAADSPETSEIHVADLDSKERRRVLTGRGYVRYAPPGFLLYATSTALMVQPFDGVRAEITGVPFQIVEVSQAAFSVSQNGVLAYSRSAPLPNGQVTWFDRSGREIGAITTPGVFYQPVVSPDRKLVALDRVDPLEATTDIWLSDTARGTLSRFTFGPRFNAFPMWSPDGTRIVYSTYEEGQWSLVMKPVASADEEHVLSQPSPFLERATDWSPDGRFILYEEVHSKTRGDIWMIRVAGERKPSPYLQTGFNETAGRFSPDGRWVAYTSNESGREEVYVQTFPTSGSKRQVSIDGGNRAGWRRDGKELYYTSLDGKLMAAEVRPGPRFQVGAPKPFLATRISLASRYDVASDGRFVMVQLHPEAVSPPITVVLNWPAALKK